MNAGNRQRRTFQGDRAPIHRAPRHDSEQVSELFRGDEVHVLAQSGAQTEAQTEAQTRDWVRCEHKGLAVKGYVWRPTLDDRKFTPTHVVKLALANLYTEPSQHAFTSRWLPMNAAIRLTGDTAPLRYPGGQPGMPSFRLDTGEWLVSSTVAAVAEPPEAITVRARRFLDTPYAHGGRSYAGMDEGGLVQAVLSRFGRTLPHVQLARPDLLLSQLTPAKKPSRSGGIVASDSFLGIWTTDETLIYASADDMCVVEREGRGVMEKLSARTPVHRFQA